MQDVPWLWFIFWNEGTEHYDLDIARMRDRLKNADIFSRARSTP